jgi:hypothetical protein
MSWSIAELKNEVAITEECARDLVKVLQELCVIEDHENESSVYQDGKLYFNPDHSEHMDYLHNEEVLQVLKQHKVNGDICFGDVESEICFWGYSFNQGKMTRLKGEVVWSKK